MARAWLRRSLPHPRSLRENRALRWLGPVLDVPGLWKADRRGIATGLAVGTFFGLLLPFAQMAVAGLVAAWLRVNLAAAVLATFVSNPFTTPLILVGAFHVGAAALGEEAAWPADAPHATWLDQLAAAGEPLLAGLVIVAGSGAAIAYAAVLAAWRAASWSRLRRRRARRASSRASPDA